MPRLFLFALVAFSVGGAYGACIDGMYPLSNDSYFNSGGAEIVGNPAICAKNEIGYSDGVITNQDIIPEAFMVNCGRVRSAIKFMNRLARNGTHEAYIAQLESEIDSCN